jgi:S-methylmethionine-dependent homocysteine/selenocysteine methylase
VISSAINFFKMFKVILLDGGMSRELIRLNAPFRQPEWSSLALMEIPHVVEQVHAEFAAAGAQVLTTNSYALVPFHIGEERFFKQGEKLAANAGRLARKLLTLLLEKLLLLEVCRRFLGRMSLKNSCRIGRRTISMYW